MTDKFITQIFKESFKARYNNNKLINNLANYGGNPGTNLFVNRNGEYNGIVIELEERVYPLFTDNSVHSIYLNIESNYTNNMGLIEKFNLVNLYQKYSNELFRFMVDQFLISNNAQPIYSDYPKIISNIKSKEIIELKTRINSDTHTLIPCKIKVVSCGELLPEDWIGKVFESGESFHRAIDGLEARINKPPVTYLANYCMEYVQDKKILDIKTLDLNKLSNVWVQDNKTKKFVKYVGDKLNVDLDSYVEINCFNQPIYIIYSKVNTFNLEITKLESNSVGFNVSLMQKSIRRGPETYENLAESIEKLSKVKPYNNPEHQYELMSGSRQLFWRFNISVIEDVLIYQSSRLLDIFDLVVYTYIFGEYPKYVTNPDISQKLIEVGKLILSIDKFVDFREWKEDTTDTYDFNCRYQISLGIGNKYMRGMSGDKKMIRSLLTYIKSKPKLFDIDLCSVVNKTDELYRKIGWYAGLDLHTNPQMIVQFQNAVYKITKESQIDLESCSKIIWDYSSSYNYRKASKLKWKKINDLIYLIQYIWVNPNPQTTNINLSTDFANKLWNIDYKLNENLHTLIYKKVNLGIDYLKLKFIPIKNIHNIVTATQIAQTLLSSQIKNNFWYKNKKTLPIYTNNQIKFKHLDEIIDTESESYVNIFNVYTKYLDTLVISFGKSNFKTKYIDSHIFINDISCIKVNQDYTLEYKDSIYDLEAKTKCYQCEIPEDSMLYQVIEELINYKSDEINTYINYKSIIGLQAKPEHMIKTKLVKSIDDTVKQLVLSRVLTSLEDKQDRTTLIIGSIDRSGKASGDSVDSKLEGYLLRVFNIFAVLYGCFERVSEYKFIVRTKSNIFGRWLEDMGYNLVGTVKSNEVLNTNNKQIIKTNLWNHQIKVRDMIYNGIIKYNQRGFGDASEVGSGKTLTALSCIELIDRLTPQSNYLILVPNINLYKVWEDEVKTHCVNIICSFQESNGSWVSKITTKLTNNLGPKLWVTTMGRNRDHPLVEPLAWVIIDECLSVQNKESKWTIKAFEQVVRARFGVLMLSATFFRTRFDKLFFMLKMLCTGLPTKSEYLDTILNTAIGANIKTNRIEWVTSVNKIKLDDKFYKGYNENKVSDKFESYIKLKKYLDQNVKFEEIAEEKVIQLLKLKRKVLLYVESEYQLDNFKEYVKLKKLDWGFYPDIDKNVCVISKHKGTYGINNLIGYDTILIKPPEPDKLPQIKGRLDRPGQKSTKLYMEYVVIADTIEEIDLVKLELSNNFYRGHIIPLANYYDKYC